MKKHLLLLLFLAALSGAAQAQAIDGDAYRARKAREAANAAAKYEWERKHEKFFDHSKHSYMGWTLINTGYPFTLGMGLVGRHGKHKSFYSNSNKSFVGFGYYANIGWDIGGGMTYESDNPYNTFAPLHYSVGLKLFPYKSIFLSAGYGTLGAEKMQVSNSDEGRFNTEGWRQGKGLMLTGGYDLLGNLNGGGGAFLSLSAGVGYDMYLQSWKPMASLRFGVAWGL